MPTRSGRTYLLPAPTRPTVTAQVAHHCRKMCHIQDLLVADRIEEEVEAAMPLKQSRIDAKQNLSKGTIEEFECTAESRLSLNGETIILYLDSGAVASMASEELLRRYAPYVAIQPLSCSREFFGIGKSKVRAIGSAVLNFYFEGTFLGKPAMAIFQSEIYVVPSLSVDNIIIGSDVLKPQEFVLDFASDKAIIGACEGVKIPVGIKKNISATQQNGKSIPKSMRYKQGGRRSRKLQRRREATLQQAADEMWGISRAPYLENTSQVILAREAAKYQLSRLPSGIQLLEDRATTVKILKCTDESFELLVTSKKTEWLRQSIDPDMVPTFLPDYRIFYYSNLDYYGCAYSWHISFNSDKAMRRFRSVLIENGLYSPDNDG